MITEATCKFCKRPLSLQIDDDYAALGDPFKLTPLACCDGCADYMMARRKIFDRVKHICMKLFGGAVEKDDLPKTREALTALVQRYMRLISDHRDCPMPDWDSGLMDDLMEKPGNFSPILAMVPRMFQAPSLL